MSPVVIIIIVVTLIVFLIKTIKEESWLSRIQKKQKTRFDYMHGAIMDNNENMRWDEEKGRWIDKEKEARMEKYRKYHEGQPPTFEEWKAQREKEQKEKEQQE